MVERVSWSWGGSRPGLITRYAKKLEAYPEQREPLHNFATFLADDVLLVERDARRATMNPAQMMHRP